MRDTIITVKYKKENSLSVKNLKHYITFARARGKPEKMFFFFYFFYFCQKFQETFDKKA